MDPVEVRDSEVQADEEGPPPRPRRWDELKFKRQKATRWFDPRVLGKSGLRVVLSTALGEFLDKRELQSDREQGPFLHLKDERELWFDFIADTGDGFDATYTVAWMAAQPFIELNGQRLPRGRLLVLGGDEVYPVASADEYERRFERPFEASLPWIKPPDNPELYAIPGNHDWYDGLTSFLRLFCRTDPRTWVGARYTRQSRSYFAVLLPCRWWLWGIDIQLDSYIDDDQQEYFRKVPLAKDDRVILCTATPSWVEGGQSRSFQNLAFLEENFIRHRGAKLVLSLSGDSHHYARYSGDDGTQKITAGGGGAFTHPTHTLSKNPLTIEIGGPRGDPPQNFTALTCYPERKTSFWMSLGAIPLLPLRNLWFLAIPGLVYLLLGWASQFALRQFDEVGALENVAPDFGWLDVLRGVVSNPVSILILVIFLGGLYVFAKPPPHEPKEKVRDRRHDEAEEQAVRKGEPRRAGVKAVIKTVMAVPHLAAHLAAVALVGLLAVKIAGVTEHGAWFTVILLVTMGLLGAVVGGLVTGLYLAVSCLFRAHGNEAFSAMRLTSYKNFLRLHLKENGDLDVYAIGIRRSVTKWDLDPDQPPEAPLIKPVGRKPEPELIEGPITIPPPPTPSP